MGKLYITPGDLTHIKKVNPVFKGEFKYIESKVDGGRTKCSQITSNHVCPGFVSDESGLVEYV